MSSTNSSQQPNADDSPVFEMPAYYVGDRCPQCQLGNKVTYLIAKGQKLVCSACWWNTKNRSHVVPVSSNICVNINCPSFDEEAQKIMQWCCKACEPTAKAFEAGQSMPPNKLLACQYKDIAGGVFCRDPVEPGCTMCAYHVNIIATEKRKAREVLEEAGFGDHPASQPYTPETLIEFHDVLCGRARDLMRKKNNDYCGDQQATNVFANFDLSYTVAGVEQVRGILQRIVDKLARIRTYLDTGKLLVSDEGMENIAVDLVNYTVLMMAFIHERQASDASRKAPIPEQPTTSPTGNADEVIFGWLSLVANNTHADPVHRAAAQQLYAYMCSPSEADQPVPSASDVVRSEG